MDLNDNDMTAQIREALITVATRHGEVVGDFDPGAVAVFGETATAVLAASDEAHLRSDLAALMVTAFMAGRIHAEAGHPSPLPDELAGQMFVPSHWA